MYYPLKSRTHRIPLLISLLIGFILAAQALPASAHAPLGSPLRLRLRMESNTLRSGEMTKIYAEFLDRDYNQVPSDGTRVIEFALASSGSKKTGSGEVSPQRVTVRPGEWSGGAIFVSRQPGKLFVTASSDGLDSSQALVLITGQQQSFLSQLFETVAYAQPQNEIEISPRTFPKAPANNKFHVEFQVGFSQASPPPNTIVRIATAPSAGIFYKNQRYEGAVDIRLDEGQANSATIGIVSSDPGIIKVTASSRPDGAKDAVEIKFDAPQPAQIVFDSEPQSIGLNERSFSIAVQLADEGGFPLSTGADRERKIHVSSATDRKLVDFEPETIVLAQGRTCAQSVMHFKQVPAVSEMKLLAWDEGDTGIKAGQKTITIQRPIPVSATWLLFAAIFGGAIGGLARQLYKGVRLDHIMPQWTGRDWDLGLTGRIMGSVVSGLFLYWAIKLGLAQVTFDLGTRTVAVFFGGIGGFAGLVVLDRLVEWCFKIMDWKSPAAADPQLSSPAAVTSSPSLKNA